MIGATTGRLPVSITGLGCKVPDRIVSNVELAQYVDTSDAWILERTGIRERRMASKEEALSDVALPACRDALARAGIEGKDVDLVIVATVTPDMMFPSTGAILADKLGAVAAAAYDLSAGCTGFMYALAQAYGMLAGVSPQQAQVVLLKDALGYSFEEIAEAAGMPVGTAKCHAHRGRARLRERLEDDAA